MILVNWENVQNRMMQKLTEYYGGRPNEFNQYSCTAFSIMVHALLKEFGHKPAFMMTAILYHPAESDDLKGVQDWLNSPYPIGQRHQNGDWIGHLTVICKSTLFDFTNKRSSMMVPSWVSTIWPRCPELIAYEFDKIHNSTGNSFILIDLPKLSIWYRLFDDQSFWVEPDFRPEC